MTPINHARPTAVGSVGGAAAPSKAIARSLMPTPAPLDADSIVYMLASKNKSQSTQSAKTGVIANREVQKANIEKADAELKAQREAEENKSVWDTLGKVCSCVAIAVSAVTAVVDGGALLIASSMLAVAVFAESETKFLEKCGVDPGVATALTLSCAVLGAGAGGAALFTSAKNTTVAVLAVKRITAGVEGGARVGEGVTKAGSLVCENEGNIAHMRSEEATIRGEQAGRATERIVKHFGHLAESYDRALQGLVGIVEEKAKTVEAIARGVA